MKAVAAREPGTTIVGAGRRNGQGIGFKAPGHQGPVAMPRPERASFDAVFGPTDGAVGEAWPQQMKARLAPVDDPAEREADRIADAIVEGRPIGAIGDIQPDVVWRKCAACSEEEHTLLRKGVGSSATQAPGSHAVARAASAIASGGVPLPASERSYFEPRFGRDLSDVRIHADQAAASASRDINARAFTLGNDIGFAQGEYAPGDRQGRRLIAHELAHVLQRLPLVARQPAPFHTRRFQDKSGGGSTDFIETVQAAPVAGAGGYVGSVARSEVAGASGGQPQQEVSKGSVRNIRFDPGCFITVPFGIQFQQQATAPTPFCQEPPSATPVAPLPAAELQALQTRYIDGVNAGLNGWYALRVEGCNQPCAGKPIPIRIEAQAVSNNPDLVMNVVNRSGRGNAATICVGSFDASFAAHEGGHQVLGLGDEYPEHDPRLLASQPQWGRPERVRTDLTQMGTSYGRFGLYHERHFRFAQVFLEAVYRGQGCTVNLEALRSPPNDFRIDVGFSGASSNLGSALSANAFIGAGIPLERQRRLSLLLGGQAQYLTGLAPNNRSALMMGVRAGIEAQTSPGNFGLTANVFASGGASHQFASSPAFGRPAAGASTSPYGEVGVGIGIHSDLTSGAMFRAGVEAATGRELSNDPNAMRWVRYGFTLGLSL
jgi:hypothetical protein